MRGRWYLIAADKQRVVPGAGLEPAHLSVGNFKFPASTNFTIRAFVELFCWERDFGGSGEIRTHGRLAPPLVFETSAIDHSATLP
jgi:hypothetical protein